MVFGKWYIAHSYMCYLREKKCHVFTWVTMYLSLVSMVWFIWAEASSVLVVPASEGLWEIPGLFLKYWTTNTTWKERKKRRRLRSCTLGIIPSWQINCLHDQKKKGWFEYHKENMQMVMQQTSKPNIKNCIRGLTLLWYRTVTGGR